MVNSKVFSSVILGTIKCTCNRQISTGFFLSALPNQKKTFVRDRPHFNIGTIGHVDHGKTTLTAAITKVMAEKNHGRYFTYSEIDKAPEEMKRGITINAAVIEYSTDNRHYAHTDCPGHIDYIKNMITGANQMEGAILVVAASEGTMPQTREHLLLAKQIGISNLVVFLNKADIADAEMIELVEMEIRELLDSYGYDGEKTACVAGSALCALEDKNPEIGRDRIIALLDEVDKIPLPTRETDKPFLVAIEGVHSIPQRGTVVTGRVERGVIKPGDAVEILGYDKVIKSTVTSMEMFHQVLDKAEPGDQVGMLLRGVKRDELKRGMTISKPKSVEISNCFESQIYILNEAEGGPSKPLTSTFQCQSYSRSWNIPTKFLLADEQKLIMPGEDTKLKLYLQKKMMVEPGQRFTLRNKNTLGYGVISKILPDPKLDSWDK